MEILSLEKYAEYNDLVSNIYGKLKISPYRNNLDILWLRSSRKVIDTSIQELLSLGSWTNNEKKFLDKLRSFIKPKSEKDLITLPVEKAEELVELSISALIERDDLVQKEVYDHKDYFKFKEALYLLGANQKLLKIIQSKLKRSMISQKEVDGLNNIASSLLESYLFLSGKIKEPLYLKASLENIKSIWRTYHPLEKIKVI